MTRPCRFWWPCLISLALHAAVLVPLMFVPTPRGMIAGQPLAIEAIAVEDDIHLSLEPPPEQVLNVQLVAAPPSAPSRSPVAPVVEPPPTELAGALQPVAHQEAARGHGTTGVSGTSSGSGAGDGCGVAFYAVPARGHQVVFVIDRSVSMGLNGALERVKHELLASLARLPADVRFQVILYNRSAQPLILGGAVALAPATTANRDAVARQLDALEAEGATDHLPALSLALSYEPDVIYFLTDADDLTAEQVRQVTRLNRGRAIIHTLELTAANAHREEMPLHQLARANRGCYRAVEGTTKLY